MTQLVKDRAKSPETLSRAPSTFKLQAGTFVMGHRGQEYNAYLSPGQSFTAELDLQAQASEGPWGPLRPLPLAGGPFPATEEALDLKSAMFQALPHHGPAECPWANHVSLLNLFPNL